MQRMIRFNKGLIFKEDSKPKRVPSRKTSCYSSKSSNNHPSVDPEGEVRVACEVLALAFVAIEDDKAAEDGPDEENNVFRDIRKDMTFYSLDLGPK